MYIKGIIEALLFSADRPLNIADLQDCFPDTTRPAPPEIRTALAELRDDYRTRALELTEVASGFRFQVRREYSAWVANLLQEKPARYSRALLETLAIIAYSQPVTRGKIEEIRGVGVSSAIIRTLLDRRWIRIVGHKEVPGKPALYATTREFLDYFNLKNLADLPPLGEVRLLNSIPGDAQPVKPAQDNGAEQRDIEETNEIT